MDDNQVELEMSAHFHTFHTRGFHISACFPFIPQTKLVFVEFKMSATQYLFIAFSQIAFTRATHVQRILVSSAVIIISGLFSVGQNQDP